MDTALASEALQHRGGIQVPTEPSIRERVDDSVAQIERGIKNLMMIPVCVLCNNPRIGDEKGGNGQCAS